MKEEDIISGIHRKLTRELNTIEHPACHLCGGNAGRLNDDSVHNLCAARKAYNLPIEFLGNVCPKCNGAGTTGKGGSMLFFDIGPYKMHEAINAMFPKCSQCNGTGSIT